MCLRGGELRGKGKEKEGEDEEEGQEVVCHRISGASLKKAPLSVSVLPNTCPFGHHSCSPDHRHQALLRNKKGVRSVNEFVSQNVVAAAGLRVGFSHL